MDKDRIAESAKQIIGAIKEATGKLLGDKKTEIEGALKRANGNTQNAVGGMKDTAREILNKK